MINKGMLSQEVQGKISEYIEWSPRASAEQEEIQELLQGASSQESVKEIEDRFLRRLQFGTAGLRGKMGCGYNRMNDLIVMQTTQGIATYLLNKYTKEQCTTQGVVIGYDGRHYSCRYANAVAAVFISKNFKVYLNSKLGPTPLIPFAIRQLKCLCGIQITASHNPKADNGYKVYAKNGAQITNPMDTEVSRAILENLKPWDSALKLLDTDGYLKNNDALVSKYKIDPYKDLVDKYLNVITQELCYHYDDTASTDVHFVYTPMHGVGKELTLALLKRFGLSEKNLHVVKEQSEPDPEFSTVKFPNPEEKGALDCSMALADKVNARIILANDPDADRFACAEKQPDGSWKIFTGDELGFLFAVTAHSYQRKTVKDKDILLLCSAVSSRMMSEFAKVEGCQFVDTATGFKWIMNKALDLTQNSVTKFCFAYEEALGYALSTEVPDKDGVSACAFWVQFACQLYKQKKTINSYLDELYKKYGYSSTSNSYVLCYEPPIVQEIFTHFRNNGNYPTHLGNYKIKRIRDVTAGYDNAESDLKCQLPLIQGSEMISFQLENGVTMTFRTSGTEPKLKWYSEIIGKNQEENRTVLKNSLDAALKNFLQLEKYKDHLHSPSTN